jgi:uncharacterized protein YqgC (DUF456 family)
MHALFEALAFGVAVVVMFIGLFGIILPFLPGLVLIWITALGYAIYNDFDSVGLITIAVITLITVIAVTSDLWLPILGSKKGGASKRAMVFGLIGGILGFLILTPLFPILGSIFGGIIGYAVGTLLGQYHKYKDWDIALRASIGGVAGWGASVALQMVAGILIMGIFIWQVLSF